MKPWHEYLIAAVMFCAILWMMVALSCSKPVNRLSGNGVIFNRANASSVAVIWDENNPSYTGPCSTFSHTPNYRPAGVAANYRTDAYSPLPYCWSCHGSGEWAYTNSTTAVMTYYSTAYRVQHSR